MEHVRTALGLGVLALSGPLSAQTSTLIAPSPSPQAVEDIAGANDGSWLTLLDTAASGRLMEARINGAPWLREGAAFGPVGAVIGDDDGLTPNLPFVDLAQSKLCPGTFCGILTLKDDVNATTPPVITAVNNRVLVLGPSILLQENDVVNAPEVPADTRVHTLHRSVFNVHHQALVLADLLDPLTGEVYPAVLRVSAQATCTPPFAASVNVLMKRGDALLTGRRLTSFATTEKHTLDFNDRGDWMFIGAFGASINRTIILNGRGILTETNLIPGGSGAATSLQVASVDLNDHGDYVLQVRGAISPALIRGNSRSPSQQRMFVQASSPVPDPDLLPADLLRIGVSLRFANGHVRNYAPALMTNGGDVVWYGEWTLGPVVGAAIFVNHKAVVLQGSVQGGARIDFIGTAAPEFRYEIETSPNGRYLFYEATLGTPLFTEALMRVDLGESVPYGVDTLGCNLPYLPEGLVHASDDLSVGDPVGYGGFPLRNNKTIWVRVDAPPPPGASHVALVLARNPAADPCGTPRFGTNVLLDDPIFGVPFVQPVSQQVFGVFVPTSAARDLTAYAQAFFLRPNGVIAGSTNGLRFVFGTP